MKVFQKYCGHFLDFSRYALRTIQQTSYTFLILKFFQEMAEYRQDSV